MKIWKTVSQVPPLQKDEVHIWRASLRGWLAGEIKRGLNILSSEEKVRADRFLQMKHRKRFITSHAILHAILMRYLPELWRTPPLQFRYNEYGKPYLAYHFPLQFNLSNSHSMALYAVARDQKVGIDVEYMQKDTHVNGIAERFFSPEENAALQKLPVEERLAGFYRIWTLKEAYIKAIGYGLSFPLNRFTTNVKAIRMDGLISVDGNCEQATSWALCPVLVGENYEDYKAALAVERPLKIVHYFDWTASLL
ncbi:MAG: 4'-phosphopantetheinyl transferase superfamily protein [Coxiella-like endosymbiont]